MKLSPYRKAIASAVVALTGSLAVAGVDDAITFGEALVAIAAATAAGATVFGVRNTPGPSAPDTEETFLEEETA